MSASLKATNYLKLFRIVLVKERDGNPHRPIVVAGNRIGERHLDRVIIVVSVVLRPALNHLVLAELQVFSHGHERQLLVAASMI